MEDHDVLLIFSKKDSVEIELQNLKENKCHLKCPAL